MAFLRSLPERRACPSERSRSEARAMHHTPGAGDREPRRAGRIHAFGGPEQVVVEEIAAPALEPHHARVRVVAAGVNPVDWAIREHEYNPRGADSVPMTLGQDFAGVVEEGAGDSRATFGVGDEVFGETWGSFAEHVLVPVRHLVRKPATVDFVTAASLPMPGLTAWQLVVNTAHVH